MSSKLATGRIRKELVDFKNVKDSYDFEVDTCDSNLFHLKARITGPVDTPYHGGRYQLNIELPDKYPFLPPKINFVTKIWHPNISSVTGFICLDILKDKWSASMSLRSVLMSILSLLQCPDPDSPQDGQVAKQLLSSREEFNNTARYWKLYYASNSTPADRMREHPAYEAKLCEFKAHPLVAALGKGESELVGILSSNNWNINQAMNAIL